MWQKINVFSIISFRGTLRNVNGAYIFRAISAFCANISRMPVRKSFAKKMRNHR